MTDRERETSDCGPDFNKEINLHPDQIAEKHEVMTADREARWLVIQSISDAIVQKDEAASTLEGALCGAVYRAREWRRQRDEALEKIAKCGTCRNPLLQRVIDSCDSGEACPHYRIRALLSRMGRK